MITNENTTTVIDVTASDPDNGTIAFSKDTSFADWNYFNLNTVTGLIEFKVAPDFENDPKEMIEKGFLEKVPDFSFQGEKLNTSYLGYRITRRFTHEFLGRIFTDPVSVFPEDMLKPELQDEAEYADSIKNLVEAGKLIAKRYIQQT